MNFADGGDVDEVVRSPRTGQARGMNRVAKRQPIPKSETAFIAGAIAGCALLVAGPLVGSYSTILDLLATFTRVANAEPEGKAAMLTAGIDQAMGATEIGLFAMAVGAVLSGACGFALVRRRRRDMAATPVSVSAAEREDGPSSSTNAHQVSILRRGREDSTGA